MEVTFVYEDETEVVAGGVFLVDFAEGGGEVETAQEEADGNRFSYSNWISDWQLMWIPRLRLYLLTVNHP